VDKHKAEKPKKQPRMGPDGLESYEYERRNTRGIRTITKERRIRTRKGSGEPARNGDSKPLAMKASIPAVACPAGEIFAVIEQLIDCFESLEKWLIIIACVRRNAESFGGDCGF
jgi:hypothetical protein